MNGKTQLYIVLYIILFLYTPFAINIDTSSAKPILSADRLGSVKPTTNGAFLYSLNTKQGFLTAQISEETSFFIELSYNSEKSEVLNKDILSRALREMTTTFIGSGLTYVEKNRADIIAKVYIDAEVSDYKKGQSKLYDILSKVTIKVYDKNNTLIEQANSNEFSTGSNLKELAIDSIRISCAKAARDIVAGLDSMASSSEDSKTQVITKLKIELLFEGEVNYKFFETVNKLIKDSSSKFKVLKRTIKFGESFNLLVLSSIDSQKLAEYLIENMSIKDSFEVINVSENRLVFRLNN